MTSQQIRQTFLDFFKSKQHQIVPSAPMVVKNDPTLMFTNAGMNQFKDFFLGNSVVKIPRIADTQKCLRVSGKHNDLEEVGHDTYHHTMFEMLGNWSFGDYFKMDAIAWAWELLTEVYKLDKSRLYATVFGGDTDDNMPVDTEALDYWKKYLPVNHILYGSKKDNFWEMGDTGPCGPCSEIHIDLRSEEERKAIDGASLVNQSHHLVVEIWNLVFIQFNRQADGKLVPLPDKHVDTGMGFERLCMALQGVKSNYDTDVFQPMINAIAKSAGKTYGADKSADIAIRVIADHIRTVSFAIADGQLPSNNKAGYVIRRILRRAVRYGFTFLDFKEPFLCKLPAMLAEQMGSVFPELISQRNLIEKVIKEEEQSFLRTLATGIQRFENFVKENKIKQINGTFAFELFDTYGFPIDLTQLMAREKELDVDMDGFNKAMMEQKERSRNAATVETEDWIELKKNAKTVFVGYDELEGDAEIIKFRKVKQKGKEQFQIVLDRTPFYAESGGQVGDKGWLIDNDKKIEIINTVKENDLAIHITNTLPSDVTASFASCVDVYRRKNTESNHSATHLLHNALRAVLGTHVEQKGSLVDHEHLRFDFSHFAKVSEEEIWKVEELVNAKIRENILLVEHREMAYDDAKKLGAMALFGEKYGDRVRVIKFGESVELCGGTHAKSTSQIGYFKITSESAIAAGVRRIEAITSSKAFDFIKENLAIVSELKQIFKSSKNIVASVQEAIDQNAKLSKQVAEFQKERAKSLAESMIAKVVSLSEINFLSERLDEDPIIVKDLQYILKTKVENLFCLFASETNGKAQISLIISENLVKEKSFNASIIIRELAKEIKGGGGGQPFYATAGGTEIAGLSKVIEKAKNFIV